VTREQLRQCTAIRAHVEAPVIMPFCEPARWLFAYQVPMQGNSARFEVFPRNAGIACPNRCTPRAVVTLNLNLAGGLDQAHRLADQLEEKMISLTMSTRIALALASFGVSLATLAPAPAKAQNQNMEVIHHPNYDKNVFMPFVPAIKIKSGKILWLAGTTALPVYHDHPHKRDQIQQYMVNDLETQTRAAMDGIKQTLDASGASFKDVVHYFVFRARPRMGDIGKASAVINSYFAPFNHKPTSTNVAVLELGEPEQLIEIQMFAVVD
jgi:2-iminobutanoate/2-iminopropanoate deaminase